MALDQIELENLGLKPPTVQQDSNRIRELEEQIAQLEARVKELEVYLPENVAKRRYEQYLIDSDPTGMKCLWCNKMITERFGAQKEHSGKAIHNLCKEEEREAIL